MADPTMQDLQDQITQLQNQLSTLSKNLSLQQIGINPGSNYNPLGSGGVSNVQTGLLVFGNYMNAIILDSLGAVNGVVGSSHGAGVSPGVPGIFGIWAANLYGGASPLTGGTPTFQAVPGGVQINGVSSPLIITGVIAGQGAFTLNDTSGNQLTMETVPGGAVAIPATSANSIVVVQGSTVRKIPLI